MTCARCRVDGERWLPVYGYEGRYEVSDHGRIRSFWRAEPRMLKASVVDMYGYLAVGLWDGSRQTRMRLHTVVARAFYGPLEGRETRHLDGNKVNPCLANLAYGTSLENRLDAVRHKDHWPASKTHCKRGHEFSPENTAISHRGNGRPFRICRTCRIERDQQNRAGQPGHYAEGDS